MSSDFGDLEDAVQYFASKSENIDVILTRNKKDFKFSEIKVSTPAEFLKVKTNMPQTIKAFTPD